MATIKTEYLLKLEKEDIITLKKVLGHINNNDFDMLGVQDDDRKRMSEIWRLLPSEESDMYE